VGLRYEAMTGYKPGSCRNHPTASEGFKKWREILYLFYRKFTAVSNSEEFSKSVNS